MRFHLKIPRLSISKWNGNDISYKFTFTGEISRFKEWRRIHVLTLNWNNKLESIFRKDNSFELARMVLMIYARGFFFIWKIDRDRRLGGWENWIFPEGCFYPSAILTMLGARGIKAVKVFSTWSYKVDRFVSQM